MDNKEYGRESRAHKRSASTDNETYGDFCHALRESKKEIRAHQFDHHHAQVKELGIPCVVKNGGHHLILTFKDQNVDFWPASGKFFLRKTGRYGIGLHRLCREVGRTP